MADSNTRQTVRLHTIVLAGCLAALLGCGHSQPLQPLPLQSVAPDFSLLDVNPNSPTAGAMVSPRSKLGSVSAWYFGHAT